MMAAVRAKNSTLETELRRCLFARGFRYRLHRRDLPGKPDIVMPKYSVIIFVNGCFWHYHGCRRSKIPRTRANWWRKKLEDNRTRDLQAVSKLRSLGWRIVIVWECSVRRPGIDRQDALLRVCRRVGQFLRSTRETLVISGPIANPLPDWQESS